MSSPFDTRNYLTSFDSDRVGNLFADVLVIGSGVAGARAAIEASRFGSVTLVTKGAFESCATNIAQGGIAAAVGSNDSAEAHYQDTITVGCGLSHPEAVITLVRDAPERIAELRRWGMRLDCEDGELALGREGGHSVHRVLHADGDQTGRELTRTLRRRVAQASNIRVFEDCFMIDFVIHEDTCLGVVAFHRHYGHQIIWAKQTVLSSGGCGQVWRETTNPPCATGDGIAAAYRAGATLFNMEFMQFHPTTLYIAGSARALISEAVRGDGAYLVDRSGERFLQQYHEAAELAPRDVVSRAIHDHLRKTRANCAFLDVRHLKDFGERFPHITSLCADFEIDVTKELIPVRPSAHYMIGGVQTAMDGSTSVPGLLCCGEAACTGVHGANRLASNSLLEGLVFGRLAGDTAGRGAEAARPRRVARIVNEVQGSKRVELDLADIRHSLRSVMWRNVGVVRSGQRLREIVDILNFWGEFALDKTLDEPVGWEMQNKLTVARLVAMCALERDESIGVHHRDDAHDTSTAHRYETSIRRDASGAHALRVPIDADEERTESVP